MITFPMSQIEADAAHMCENVEDVVLPLDKIQMNAITGKERDEVILRPTHGHFHESGNEYTLSDTALNGMLYRLDWARKFWDHIPKKGLRATRNNLADRLLERNHQDVLVRSKDNFIFGMNSPYYERINHDFVTQMLLDNEVMSDFDIVGYRSDYDFFSIRAISKNNFNEVGDVGLGFIISNSMSGLRALEIKMFVFVLACSNGMIIPQTAVGKMVRRIHKGGRMEYGKQNAPTYAGEKFHEIRSEVAAQIRFARSEELARMTSDTIQQAKETAVEKDAQRERIRNTLKLSETEKKLYNEALDLNIRDHGQNVWGWVQAATWMAHRPPFEGTLRQEELEMAAWRVLERAPQL